jgi:hypothetical protein
MVACLKGAATFPRPGGVLLYLKPFLFYFNSSINSISAKNTN